MCALTLWVKPCATRAEGEGKRWALQPSVEAAFQGARPGTSRPVTASGRFVRLGTASMRTTQAFSGENGSLLGSSPPVGHRKSSDVAHDSFGYGLDKF